MSTEDFKNILNELCIGMNLQIKSKETDNKRAISSVNQIVDSARGGAVWGGPKHSARLEQKSKTQSDIDMDVPNK